MAKTQSTLKPKTFGNLIDETFDAVGFLKYMTKILSCLTVNKDEMKESPEVSSWRISDATSSISYLMDIALENVRDELKRKNILMKSAGITDSFPLDNVQEAVLKAEGNSFNTVNQRGK